MGSVIVHIGEAKSERSIHSSVRLPESLHIYAKERQISLSRTLAATLTAAKREEEGGTGPTAANQKNPVPIGPQELPGSYESQKNTSHNRRYG